MPLSHGRRNAGATESRRIARNRGRRRDARVDSFAAAAKFFAPGAGRSIFRTETRAVATDAAARAKFRWYWSFLSPGIALSRMLSLRRLRARRNGGVSGPRH